MSLAACAAPEARPAAPVRCPAPPAPVLLRLEAAEHLCSPGNAGRVMKNLSALRARAEGLAAALECYERQAGTAGTGTAGTGTAGAGAAGTGIAGAGAPPAER